MIRDKPLFKKGGDVDRLPRLMVVDTFLIKGFAPYEYGNKGINIIRVISTKQALVAELV